MCTFFLRVDIFADPFLSLLAYFFLVNSYFTDNFHNVTLLSPFPSSLLPWAIRRREEKEREREREKVGKEGGRTNLGWRVTRKLGIRETKRCIYYVKRTSLFRGFPPFALFSIENPSGLISHYKQPGNHEMAKNEQVLLETRVNKKRQLLE